MLLHIDEGIDAAAQQFGHGGNRRGAGGALADGAHDDFVLPLRQLQEDALGGDEIGNTFAGHLRERGRGGGPGIGETVAHKIQGVGVLLHNQVQQDALRGEKALGPLADPIGKEAHGR